MPPEFTDPALALAMPERGYLADYVEYGTSRTMAPAEFHLASGLAQMAALLGNRVAFMLGERTYSPHVWLVLLGPAGTKKSTAISIATDMLDAATDDGALRIPQEATREALYDVLSKKPAGYMEMGEFLAFLRKASRDYMAGVKEDLCLIFDGTREMARQLRGSRIAVRYPAVTILGGAVTHSLGDWVRQRDLEGGFLSRFLFVPSSTPVEYRGMPSGSDPRRTALVRTLNDLWRVVPPAGSKPRLIGFEPDAHKRWAEYDREMLEEFVPPELTGFQGRLGTYAAKLALCYAFAERGDPTPTADDVDLAVAFVEYCRRQIWHLAGDLDSARDATDLRRFREALAILGPRRRSSEGWVPSRDVLRRMKVLRRRYDDLLDTLRRTGEVEVRTTAGGDGGRPTEEVRLVGVSPKGGDRTGTPGDRTPAGDGFRPPVSPLEGDTPNGR